MTESQAITVLVSYVGRAVMILGIQYAMYRTLKLEWWKTPFQCALAALIYGVGVVAAIWLCLYGTVAAGLLWPVYIAFGFFWSWFCIKVFRAEADKIMRPVLNNEEIDSILGENEEGQ